MGATRDQGVRVGERRAGDQLRSGWAGIPAQNRGPRSRLWRWGWAGTGAPAGRLSTRGFWHTGKQRCAAFVSRVRHRVQTMCRDKLK